MIILQKQRNLFYWNASKVLIINLTRVDEKISIIYDIDIPENLDKIEIIKNEKKNSIYELRSFIKYDVNEYEGHYFAFYRTNV